MGKVASPVPEDEVPSGHFCLHLESLGLVVGYDRRPVREATLEERHVPRVVPGSEYADGGRVHDDEVEDPAQFGHDLLGMWIFCVQHAYHSCAKVSLWQGTGIGDLLVQRLRRQLLQVRELPAESHNQLVVDEDFRMRQGLGAWSGYGDASAIGEARSNPIFAPTAYGGP